MVTAAEEIKHGIRVINESSGNFYCREAGKLPSFANRILNLRPRAFVQVATTDAEIKLRIPRAHSRKVYVKTSSSDREIVSG